MKKALFFKWIYLGLFTSIATIVTGYGEEYQHDHSPGLKAVYKNVFTRVPPPQGFLRHRAARSHIPTSSTFQVTYTGFSTEAQAQTAFQFCLDIWSTQIASSVPIVVNAKFEALTEMGAPDTSTLGFASAATSAQNFPGATANVSYPIALANKIAGVDLRPDMADIEITMNSRFSWYFGTDGMTPAGEFDFVSVVVHELCHGLGFAGSAGLLAGDASKGSRSNPPDIYDTFVEVVDGTTTAFTSITNDSTNLKTALESDKLFFNGTRATAGLSGTKPKLYAPNPYEQGSTYSHWDPNQDMTFGNEGINSLMAPSLAMAEAVHSPGAVTLGLMQDLGWSLGTTAVTANFHVREVWFANRPLQFTDFSVMATSWSWDFNNDGTPDSTEKNPIHTYTSTGSFTAKLTINGDSSLSSMVTINVLTEPAIPYSNDFNTNDGGFYSFIVSGIGSGKWRWGAGTAGNFSGNEATIEGANNWMTGNGDSHGFDSKIALESPPFSLANASGDYFLDFKYRAITGTDAGFNINYSIDSGTTWQILPLDAAKATNWYNKTSIAALGNQPGWDGNTFAIVNPTYKLNFLAGQSDIRFRFVFAAVGFSNSGIQIDEFKITNIPISAIFQPTRTEWFANRTLQFTDTSVQATSWAWDFDNNGTVDSIIQNPQHIYSTSGDFIARLTINGNASLTTTVVIKIFPEPLVPYSNDFNTDGGGFFPSVISGSEGKWEWGAANSGFFNSANGLATIEGAGNWVTNLNSNHGFDSQYVLESPPFSLLGGSGTYTLSFKYRGSVFTGAGMNVEFSTDGGGTWSLLGGVGDANGTAWYNQASIGGLNNKAGWHQNLSDVFSPTFNISSLIGQSDIRFRFFLGAQGFAGDGFQVDNFAITGTVVNPVVSITADSVISVENNTSTVTFTASLNTPSTNTVTAAYTIGGTASLTSDYVDAAGNFSIAGNGTISFAASESSKTIKLTVVNDSVAESSETVTITLSAPNNATVGTAVAIHTITDDDTSSQNPPVITSDGGGATAAISIAENQTVVTTITSSDPENGIVTYTITDGSDKDLFSLNTTSGVLTFSAVPDFETRLDSDGNNTYVVKVTATDDGAGNLTDVQTITVTITDVNEPPAITSNEGGATAAISVAENQTLVTTLTSSDPESDTVSYSIIDGVDRNSFLLDATTGVLTFTAAPNFESPLDDGTNNTYIVEVTATDNGEGNLTDVQTITVTVTDANEPPTITSNDGGATAAISVAENQSAATTLTSTDPESNMVSYSITDGSDKDLFSLNTTSGVLTFSAVPDFETRLDSDGNNTYVVEVTATDDGAGNLTDVQMITVTVTDVNESPAITSNGGGDTASISVAENQTAVTTVTSSDPETDTVTYTLSGGLDQGSFSINTTNGVLTFTTAPTIGDPMDSDNNNIYIVDVTATDDGTGTLTDVQTITVTVTDVNEAPVITSNGAGSTAAISVAENQTAVTTITSSDPETDTVTYTLSGGLDQGSFSLNTTSGVLTFSAVPDFETRLDSDTNNTYIVEVTATDDGAGNLTDMQMITVTVTDANEAPAITSNGGGDTAAISVAENQTSVTTVTSSDPESDMISYTLTDGSDRTSFSLDVTTGVLTFTAAPNFESPTDGGTNNTYIVEVTATDDGAGNLTDVQTITVTVTDVNEAPEITSNDGGATAAISVAENQSAVTTLTSTDPESNMVSYSITDGSDKDLFSLNTTSGVLTFSAVPDFETRLDSDGNNTYVVEVTATDDGAGTLTGVQTITVTITDVNDAPKITSNGGGSIADIKNLEQQTVTTVMSIDEDSNVVTYSLAGGADLDKFSINTDSGELTFKTTPEFTNPTDADTNNIYTVEVTATDNGAGALTDSQIINVTVTVATSQTLNLTIGWNLISVSIESDSTINDLFGHLISGRVWQWTGQAFVPLASNSVLQPKIGYWIFSKISDSVSVNGTIQATSDINLNNGWNLIGAAASLPLSVSTFAFNDVLRPMGAFQEPIWNWNGRIFIVANQLKLGQGYWVFYDKPIDETASYRITFDATWSISTHPDGFPSGAAHFSPLIGGTHNGNVTLWDVGSQASPGIESMAEVGGTSILRGEVESAQTNGHTQASPFDPVVSGSGINSPGSTSTTFTIHKDFPLVTLVSMIAPSPDWFVGVRGLSLIENSEWVNTKVVELIGYDAGTEDGSSFSTNNPASDPIIPIFILQDPPFKVSGVSIPLGTFTFERQ